MSQPPEGPQRLAYPMTREQEAIWVDEHMTNGPSRYLESWVFRLSGPVDREAVYFALRQISVRHESLRSQFTLLDDQPLQVVLPIDTELPIAEQPCPPAEIDAVLRQLVSTPMDLRQRAVRATLLAVSPRDVIVALQLHHIVIDDWALQLLQKEFIEHYSAYAAGRAPQVDEVPLQPGPYAITQLAIPRDKTAERYWRDNLRDLPVTLPSPSGGQGVLARAGRVEFRFSESTAAQIRSACKRMRVTPFTLFASVSALILYAERKSPDLIVGCPVSFRKNEDQQLMIACMSGLLPLRVQVLPDEPLARLVADVKTTIRAATEHSTIPFDYVIRLARARKKLLTGSLFPIVTVVDDGESVPEIPGVNARRVFVPSGAAKFDLYFYFLREGNSYAAYLDYATEMFTAAAAAGLTGKFTRLLELIGSCPELPVSESIEAVASCDIPFHET